MLRVKLFILFTAFILTEGVAQKMSDSNSTNENALLWKIQQPDHKGISYLFGTMHLIEEAYFYFPDKLEKLLKNSDLLVLELPGLPNPLEVQKYIELTEGNVFDFFNEQQEDSLLQWAKEELKLNETSFRATFGKYKPFAIVQLAVQLQFLGNTKSYEMQFEELAQKYKRKIIGLETIEQQLRFFDNLSKEQQTEMVMETVRNPQKSLQETRHMQQLYKQQQIDSLYAKIHEDGGVIADQQEAFLDNRNKAWIPQIKEIIKQNNAFIAVGAGHLGGQNGLINLLRKNGFNITPISLD